MENEIKFPHYCCFGKLQDGSLNEDDEKITAVYLMFGLKVHELCFEKKTGRWSLEEFSPDGQRTMFSTYSTLDHTVCYHMNYMEDTKNEFLKLLRSEVLKLGTVWFAPVPSMKNGDIVTSYSPAGKLFAIRLLFSPGDDFRGQIEMVQDLFEYHDPETTLKLKIHDFYETSCIIKRSDDSNYKQWAYVAEYIVPLAYVYDAMKLFHDRGMLIRNALNRVFVEDVSILYGNKVYNFPLADIPGATGYAVILKGLMTSHEEFKAELTKMEQNHKLSPDEFFV